MNALVQTTRPSGQAASRQTSQYLTFQLRGELFAIGILHIKEIIEFCHLTTVPMMPPAIRGVINLRGAVVPVIDLASRFGGEPGKVTRKSCIVILELQTEGEHQVMGIVVDAVNEVLEIGAADIEPAPAFGARIRTDFIQGMGKVDGRFVIILDVDRVLSTAELALVSQLGVPEEQTA